MARQGRPEEPLLRRGWLRRGTQLVGVGSDGGTQLIGAVPGARSSALLVTDHVPGGTDGGELQQTGQKGAHQRRHHQLQHQLRLLQLNLKHRTNAGVT